MSIRKITLDTVVIVGFLIGTGFVFNHIVETPLSNPLLGNTIDTQEQA